MTEAVHMFAEEAAFRQDAVRGSKALLHAIASVYRLPQVWFTPTLSAPPRLKSAKRPAPPAPPKHPCPRRHIRSVVKRVGHSVNMDIVKVQIAVADHFDIHPAVMSMHDRTRRLAIPRQVAMYLARTITGASYPAVGRHFQRDHTTVIHACRAVTADPALVSHAQAIQAKWCAA